MAKLSAQGRYILAECFKQSDRDRIEQAYMSDMHILSKYHQVIEELGAGAGSDIHIVEIPDDVKWHIAEYDGLEHVAENHRTWY